MSAITLSCFFSFSIQTYRHISWSFSLLIPGHSRSSGHPLGCHQLRCRYPWLRQIQDRHPQLLGRGQHHLNCHPHGHWESVWLRHVEEKRAKFLTGGTFVRRQGGYRWNDFEKTHRRISWRILWENHDRSGRMQRRCHVYGGQARTQWPNQSPSLLHEVSS